ncbi:magnesium transporter [Botrimarina hoheduenensis]|uniref:Magnesium transporter MgtE n=1 Tax=Botrimarina hoheduenensis TaxID=2528000 RepID=A0A5C5WD85_9BACT|nr:magnesium transporter [Botrimarina hoheduenensis]TWT48457.1 Magnesium transporter MgtE [Botrimarina hoheduenensis]
MAVAHLEDNVLLHTRSEFIRVGAGLTVADALVEARRSNIDQRVLYFYVVDDEERLVGVLPTRTLLLSEPHQRVREIMVQRVVSLPSSATLADACEFFLLHRLLALPVIDQAGRMVGVVDVHVYAEEMSTVALHDAEEEEANDFFQIIGVRLEEVRRATPAAAFRRRLPWLMCNVGGGLAAAVVADAFEGVLARAVAVAAFIPVVLALAESVSIQSLTLTLQAHHSRGRMRFRRLLGAIAHELPVGALLGVACAAAIAGVAVLWKGDSALAVCLLATIATTVTLATGLGVLVPLTLHMLRTDPRIAAGPITLTLTDLATLATYLSLAAALL